jgi:pyridoxamine 5'-phosphate oxidase
MSGPDGTLRRADLEPDPVAQFRRWYGDAEAVLEMPEAVALATADATGRPSVRMVLAKTFDDGGFKFHTGHGSRKGRELAANARGALLFYWSQLGRQVRIEGPVARLSREESESYARTRSHASRLSALASPQSRPVPSREWLEERVAELAEEHADGDVPLGDDWGGYRLLPEAWEFWQHRPDRLHDRFRYLPEAGGGWRIERLGP